MKKLYNEKKWEEECIKQRKNPRCWFCHRTAEQITNEDYTGSSSCWDDDPFIKVSDAQGDTGYKICRACYHIHAMIFFEQLDEAKNIDDDIVTWSDLKEKLTKNL